jgi:asparagine synthase (glutamine-hydrolysing)
VKSFTIRFEQGTYDESREARELSYLMGTHHFEGQITPNLLQDLPRIISAIGQPLGDTSILPTWYLCQATRKNVTVALSGDGADEIFGGYKRYLASEIVERTKWFPYGLLERFIRLWPDSTEYYGKSWSKKIRLFLLFRQRQKQSPSDLTAQVFLKKDRQQLFSREYWYELNRNDIVDFHLEKLSPTERMLYVDSMRYLPDDILVKVDRMSMAHSLEVRTPFLDHNLVEFCARLPIEYKIRYFSQKDLLKKTVKKLLPAEVVKRPKHGFASPVSDILKNSLRDYFKDIVFGDAKISFFNRKEIERLWSDHQGGKIDNGMKLWTIFIFYCWYRQASLQ